MGFFKSLLKVAKVAAPIALGFVPGMQPLAAAAIGAGLGATGGGGLKGALLGGAGGYLGAGGLTSTATGGLGGTALGNTIQGAKDYVSGNFQNLLRGAGLASNASGAGDILWNTASDGINWAPLGQSISGIGAGTGFGIGSLGNLASNAYSAYSTGQTAKKIANAQQFANQQALNALSPYSQSGEMANTRLQALLGLSGDSQGALDALRNSPGYQFRLEQGQKQLDRSLAARGGLYSGRALQATQELGQGLADQTYQDYLRNLASQASQGANMATQMGQLYGLGGDIRANRLATATNANQQALANMLLPRNYYYA